MELQKSVASFYGKRSTTEILELFKDKLISRSTIFRVSNDFRDGKEQENKTKSIDQLYSTTEQQQLLSAKNKVGQLQRKSAKKYGISQPTVGHSSRRNNLNVHKCKNSPKYTAKQLEKIPKCCRTLHRNFYCSINRFALRPIV